MLGTSKHNETLIAIQSYAHIDCMVVQFEFSSGFLRKLPHVFYPPLRARRPIVVDRSCHRKDRLTCCVEALLAKASLA